MNPVTNKAYAVNYSANSVSVIDGATNRTTAVTAGTGPNAMAVNPVTNKIYVNNTNNNRVTVIDGATNDATTVSVGINPYAVAANPVTNKIYVANSGSNNVTVIDGATNGTATVTAGRGPDGVAVNPVTNRIYVVNWTSNNVTVIDGATNGTATVAVGTDPSAVAVNPVTNRIYVSNGSAVTVIDGATNGTTSVTMGTDCGSLAVNPVTNRIYVTNGAASTIKVIDGATNGVTTVTVGLTPNAVAVNPATNRIYVTNWGSSGSGNTVSVIDGATNGVTTVTTSSTYLQSVAVNPVTNKVYVPGRNTGNVTLIDGMTNSITTVAAGTQPGFAVVNPVTNRVYIANYGSNNVTVITDASENDTRVRAVVSPTLGSVTVQACPVITGKAVNRSAPGRTKMLGVGNWTGTAQQGWRWATVTSGAGTDSIQWAWNWASESLLLGENFVCCVPLEGQAGTTGNLGLGSPFAGNLQVYPLYRGAHDVGAKVIIAPKGTVTIGTNVTPACSVYNHGSATESYDVRMEIGSAYDQTATVSGHAPGATVYVTFPVWTVKGGTCVVSCSTELATDFINTNDKQTGSVIGGGGGWSQKSPMPAGAKPMKDGGWLAYDAGMARIYASRGQKLPDFYSYNPAKDSWAALRSWLPGTEIKPPAKGSAGCADGSGHVYATKGNNTLGFWLYDAAGNAWTQKKDVPLGASNKKLKGGTDIVWAYQDGIGYAYLLKGYKNEFYRYHVDGDSWHALDNAPVGFHLQWDKGSWLAYDGMNTIYAHKAKYHEFYSYNLETDAWNPTALAGMPMAGTGGSKKSKDGGCGAYYGDGKIYALKGGNTQQFFKYIVATNSWTEEETIPRGTLKKKPAAGADVVTVGTVLYATKGNKTNELWKYVPSDFLFQPGPGREGVQASSFVVHRPSFTVSPNPLASGFAVLRYGLPMAGAASVTLYDMAGRAVLTRTLAAGRAGSVNLDLRHLSNGVYLVRFSSEGFASSQKLVVQR